jgi:hypothetical protein
MIKASLHKYTAPKVPIVGSASRRFDMVRLGPDLETTMRKLVLTVFGVLLVGGLTMQTAAATTHHARKAVRAPVSSARQPRDAFGSVPSAAPADTGTRSCDIVYCYPD